MRPSILCVALLLLAFGWTANARKSSHPIRSLAEDPAATAPADAAASGAASGAAAGAASSTETGAPSTGGPMAAASTWWKRRSYWKGGSGCGSGCGSSCGGGGGCGGECGGGCPPPAPAPCPECGDCGTTTPPPCNPCGSSSCGGGYSGGWGKHGRKLQAAADEATKEVSALKTRVSELEQAQHDMAAVVAALQQQLGLMQDRLAAEAKSA